MSVSPGQKIRIAAADWNSMQETAAAFRLNKLSGGTGSPNAAPSERFRNDAATAIPQYGVGCISGVAFQGVNLVTQAPYAGFSRLVIAAAPGDPAGVFEGWTEGLHPVRVAAAQFAGIAIGDRIGAQPASWDAIADPTGTLLVTGKLDSPFVMALFVGQAGRQMITTDPADPAPVVIPSAGCIMEITGCMSERPVFLGRRPRRTGLSNFVITLAPMAIGGITGCVGEVGAEALVLAAGTTGYVAGDSLGVVKDSFYAGINRLGPMEIVKVVGVVGANTQCRVRITGKRGDHKIVKRNVGTFVVVESLEWDTVFSVTAGTDPGTTNIS